jgi:DNA-binding transcriptional regulator YiaG
MADTGKNKAEWDKERVRALRQHLSLTQDQMARELGTRQQTISEWERGLYRPRGASRTVLSIVAERAEFRYNASPEISPDANEGDESE